MSKILSAFVITAIAVFSFSQFAFAAAASITSAGFGGLTTIPAAALGTGKPATAQTFTPSSGVSLTGVTDGANYFNIVAQHEKGDKVYGLHSNGGSMYYKAVTTTGTMMTGPATATSDAATDFTGWTAM